MSSFLTIKEIANLGLKTFGNNVLISRFSRFYNPQNIEIGNNVRIDDFSVISGGTNIKIGNYVHIASHVGMWGHNGIELNDFSGISSGTKIYSESDDFSGKSLTGPMIPDKYKYKIINQTEIKEKLVRVGKHVIVGANSVILPSVKIGEGCAIGCGSIVNKNCEEWKIYAGVPIRCIGERSKDLLEMEKRLLRDKL